MVTVFENPTYKMKKLQHISNFKEAFITAEKEYHYQPLLTDKLDNRSGDFSEQTLLEIVLWKTNRYPTITQVILEDINDLRKNYSEEKARTLLKKLLGKKMKGYDLPMASTVLRFAVPDELQIIDQRVYRFIKLDKECLNIPYNIDKKVDLYFDYIKQLKIICKDYEIPFSKADCIFLTMWTHHSCACGPTIPDHGDPPKQ